MEKVVMKQVLRRRIHSSTCEISSALKESINRALELNLSTDKDVKPSGFVKGCGHVSISPFSLSLLISSWTQGPPRVSRVSPFSSSLNSPCQFKAVSRF